MERTRWFDRKFNFDYPEGWIYNIMSRLRDTPLRMRNAVAGLTEEQLCAKPDGKWSIKENIGHLIDLEELHEGRIDDFEAGKADLRPADLQNRKTFSANHNTYDVHELINHFENKRRQFLLRLEKLDDETQRRKAMHPRLQILMRPADVAFFTAEHDDHHMTDIYHILKTF